MTRAESEKVQQEAVSIWMAFPQRMGTLPRERWHFTLQSGKLQKHCRQKACEKLGIK